MSFVPPPIINTPTLLIATKKVYRCKHCKVQVAGPKDFRPIVGREHKKGCPRRRLGR